MTTDKEVEQSVTPNISSNVIQPYYSKGITKEISVTSRASAKIGNNYYTFEYSETKCFPINDERLNVDIDKERHLMWQDANNEVDNQLIEIQEFLKNSNN